MRTVLRKWMSMAFNSSVIEKKRQIWIDYLRGIVIILVVYHHAFLGMRTDGISFPQSVVDANMAAYSFRMPLFFIFSGLFTSLSLTNKSVKQVVRSKFNILFYPYLVWALIYITLQIVFSHFTNSTSTYKDYLYILYQPKRLAHFWYLPALFNSTLIFIFIKTTFRIRTGYHLLLGTLFFLVAPFINNISMISNWMRFYIFLVIGDTLSHVILKKEIQEHLKKPVYLLSFIPAFVIAQFYYFNIIGARSLENDSAVFQINYINYVLHETGFLIISLIGCITFILLSFLIAKWNRWKWLRIVGFHSLYIYIMHVFVVAFVRMVLVKSFGTGNYAAILLISIAFGVVVPIAFYNLVGKKYLWFLFSPQRKVSEETMTKSTNTGSTIRLPSPRLPQANTQL